MKFFILCLLGTILATWSYDSLYTSAFAEISFAGASALCCVLTTVLTVLLYCVPVALFVRRGISAIINFCLFYVVLYFAYNVCILVPFVAPTVLQYFVDFFFPQVPWVSGEWWYMYSVYLVLFSVSLVVNAFGIVRHKKWFFSQHHWAAHIQHRDVPLYMFYVNMFCGFISASTYGILCYPLVSGLLSVLIGEAYQRLVHIWTSVGILESVLGMYCLSGNATPEGAGTYLLILCLLRSYWVWNYFRRDDSSIYETRGFFFCLVAPLVAWYVWLFAFYLAIGGALHSVTQPSALFVQPSLHGPPTLESQGLRIGRNKGIYVDDPKFDEYLSRIEDVAIFCSQFAMAHSAESRTLAVAAYWKTISGRSILMQAASFVPSPENYMRFIELANDAFGSDYESQSLSTVLEKGDFCLKTFRQIRGSRGVEKLTKFLMYALSLGMFQQAGITFDTFGFNRMEEAHAKKKYRKDLDFVECLLDTALWVTNAGFQVFRGVPLSSVIHSGSGYVDFLETLKVFETDIKRYTEYGICTDLEYTRLYGRLTELEDKCKEIWCMNASFNRSERNLFIEIQGRLKTYRAMFLSDKLCQSERQVPFSILLYGASGVGKSSIITALRTGFASFFDLPTGSDYSFTHSPTADYWDGFDPRMWCLIMDDIAFAHPKSQQPDKSVLDVISVVNNVPFMPNQASLEKKGRTPFLGRLVIATTNTKDFNAASYFAFPSAATRRFPWVVTVAVRDEYKTPEGALDSHKIAVHPNTNDYWTFTVERAVAVGHKTEYQDKQVLNSMPEFMYWYAEALRDFSKSQSNAERNLESIRQWPVCDECKLIEYMCHCRCKDCGDSHVRGNCPLNSGVASDSGETFGCETSSESDSSRSSGSESEEGICVDCGFTESICKCDGSYCSTCATPSWLCTCGSVFRGCVNCKRPNCTCGPEASMESQGLVTSASLLGLGWIASWFARTESVRFAQYTVRNLMITGHITALDAICAYYFYRVGDYKRVLHRCGERIQNVVLRKPAFLIMLGTLLVLGGVAFSLRRKIVSQGARLPKPLPQEAERYYYNGDERPATSFIASPKGYCTNLDNLAKVVQRNVVFGNFREIDDGVGSTTCRLTGVGGQYYLTNAHNVPKGDVFFFDVRAGPAYNGVSDHVQSTYTQANVVRRDEKRDLALLFLPGMPPKTDVRGYFLSEEPTGYCEGFYIDRDPTGNTSYSSKEILSFRHYTTSTVPYPIYCAFSEEFTTEKGQCGMPLIGKCGKAHAIIGIHALGRTNGKGGGAAVVTKAWLDESFASIEVPVVSQSAPDLSAPGFERKLTSLHRKSTLRYLEGTGSVMGSFIGFRETPRSRVITSPIAPWLAKEGVTTTFGQPVMSGWRPWRIAAMDLCNPVVDLRYDRLRKASNAYLDTVLARLPEGAISEIVHPIDLKTNLNGYPGIAYLDGIKRGTSAGAPFRHSKRHHLQPDDPCALWADPVRMDDLVTSRYNKIKQVYRQGELYHPVFTAHLKDEAVSAKKRETGKTRVFCGAPMDWSIVVRELFMGHVRLIQNCRFAFECAVGAVAQSDQWSEIYDYITEHGTDRMVAGDYKAYDKRMSPDLILEAFRVLIRLAELSGNFDDEELLSMWCCAYDTCFPLNDFNGDLVMFWGSNPSGHPLTVIINSIANSIYMRYAYGECGYDVDDFGDHVALLTYGDDNMMSVSELRPNFHHTSIARALGEVGVTYTMADKEAESVPYVDMSEVTFLKRAWRFCDEENVWLAPLEIESVHKMLCVLVESKTVTLGEQVADIIRSAHSEMFFHGEDSFRTWDARLRRLILDNDLSVWFQDQKLPTYGQLWQRFRAVSEKSRTTFIWGAGRRYHSS